MVNNLIYCFICLLLSVTWLFSDAWIVEVACIFVALIFLLRLIIRLVVKIVSEDEKRKPQRLWVFFTLSFFVIGASLDEYLTYSDGLEFYNQLLQNQECLSDLEELSRNGLWELSGPNIITHTFSGVGAKWLVSYQGGAEKHLIRYPLEGAVWIDCPTT